MAGSSCQGLFLTQQENLAALHSVFFRFLPLGRAEINRRGNSKAVCKVATKFAPSDRRLRKDMCRDWFSVYLKNHLNLVIALPTRYLAMSSLIAFRSLRVVKKFGDELFCCRVEPFHVFKEMRATLPCLAGPLKSWTTCSLWSSGNPHFLRETFRTMCT